MIQVPWSSAFAAIACPSSGSPGICRSGSVAAAGELVALAPWRKPLARHDPAKVLVDLAVTLALGGDCLADVALLRGAPELFGSVASDPTVSRPSTCSPAIRKPWLRSPPRGRRPAPPRGGSPESMLPTPRSMLVVRWSSISTRL